MSIRRPVAQEVQAEQLTRLQVVERAGRALKMLIPLAQLCDELGKIDNIDRAADEAQARHDSMVADLAAQRAKIDAANAEAAGKAEQIVSKAIGDAQTLVDAAKKRAADLEIKAVKRDEAAAEAFAKAEAGRAARLAQLDSDVNQAEKRAEAMALKLEQLAAEIAAGEKKMAEIRKKAQAALGELGA